MAITCELFAIKIIFRGIKSTKITLNPLKIEPFGGSQIPSTFEEFPNIFKTKYNDIKQEIKKINDDDNEVIDISDANANINSFKNDYFYLKLKDDTGKEYEGLINNEGKFQTLKGFSFEAEYTCPSYRYRGYFDNGYETGGFYKFKNGNTLKGKLKKDSNGESYEGECTFTDNKQQTIYTGFFDKKLRSGYGETKYLKDKKIEKGEYKDDKRQGVFIIYDKKNNEIELCNYNNDIKEGYGIKVKLNTDNEIKEITENYYYLNDELLNKMQSDNDKKTDKNRKECTIDALKYSDKKESIPIFNITYHREKEDNTWSYNKLSSNEQQILSKKINKTNYDNLKKSFKKVENNFCKSYKDKDKDNKKEIDTINDAFNILEKIIKAKEGKETTQTNSNNKNSNSPSKDEGCLEGLFSSFYDCCTCRSCNADIEDKNYIDLGDQELQQNSVGG